MGSYRVLTVWAAYFLAEAAASGIFVAAGWRSKRARGLAAAQGSREFPVDPLWGEEEVDISPAEAKADVSGAVRLVLKRLAPLMESQSVQVEIAIPSGLLVRMRRAALAELLEELLASAIHDALASRLLLTAARHGDRIHLGITDDMPGADPAARRGRIRGLMERVAMRGGALDLNVRLAEGTTMTLRLAAVDESERPAPVIEQPSGVSAGFAVRIEL